MKKLSLLIFSLFASAVLFAQSGEGTLLPSNAGDTRFSFTARKEKGFYSVMQMSLLFGNSQITDRTVYYIPYNPGPVPLIGPSTVPNYSDTRTTLAVAPSFTLSNGYIFNEHWATGAGAGFEIFDHNLFPLFAELRYTQCDHTIAPFIVIKGGYSLAGLKARHHDELNLNWPPYYLDDAKLRNYGGLMIHPEIGVKIPLTVNSDLLFTVAYRYQKTKTVVRKDYDNGQFDEWKHRGELNRLSFGVAFMFR